MKNEEIYNHWAHNWVAQIPKEIVVQNLQAAYDGINKIADKNAESYLLLGDIAHYLYNLELEPFYKRAVDNYVKAKLAGPDDYRVYWFLANHYGLSNQPDLSIETFRVALQHLPAKDVNAFFWFDYAICCVPAGMISTALYAMDKYSKLTNGTAASNSFINSLKQTFKVPRSDTTVELKDMWSATGKQNNKLLFASRVIGTRIAVDSNWAIDLRGWQNSVSAAILSPPKIMNKVDNTPIGYTILTLVRTPGAGQSLTDFLNLFIKKYDVKTPIVLTNKYNHCVAYEIKDPSIYQNMGGGHIYAIAIERDEPEYPGMVLESPNNAMSKGSKGLSYYRMANQYTRLKGKLYYLVMLDSCEYINKESFTIFKEFLENGLVIE